MQSRKLLILIHDPKRMIWLLTTQKEVECCNNVIGLRPSIFSTARLDLNLSSLMLSYGCHQFVMQEKRKNGSFSILAETNSLQSSNL